MSILRKNSGGKDHPEIQGNWEERGVIGIRVEIIGDSLTVLWRGGPVLETRFKAEEGEDGALSLKLDKNGLRYKGAANDYATVTGITYRDEKLTFEEHFPITGPSVTVLSKTENNRYGNYEIRNDLIKGLEGTWTDGSGYNELVFKDDTMTVNGKKIRFVVLKPCWSANREYIIRDADPSKELPYGLSAIRIEGDTLVSSILVCDAPSIPLTFRRK